jgi:hypothetical protein
VRTLLAGIGAGVLAIVLAVIGYEHAHDLARWKVGQTFGEVAGSTHLVYTNLTEPVTLLLRFALAFAWPALVVGIAVVVYRVRADADPSWRRIAIYTLIVFAYWALVMFGVWMLFPPYDGDLRLQPVIAMSSLAPGRDELERGIAVLVALAGYTWFSAPRPPSRAASVASRTPAP